MMTSKTPFGSLKMRDSKGSVTVERSMFRRNSLRAVSCAAIDDDSFTTGSSFDGPGSGPRFGLSAIYSSKVNATTKMPNQDNKLQLPQSRKSHITRASITRIERDHLAVLVPLEHIRHIGHV